METLNSQQFQPENKLNLPKKSISELEGKNFKHYVIDLLAKKGEAALALLVNDGKINLGLEQNKAVETGNIAELSNDNFDVTDHMTMRAEMFIQELIKNKKEYLN